MGIREIIDQYRAKLVSLRDGSSEAHPSGKWKTPKGEIFYASKPTEEINKEREIPIKAPVITPEDDLWVDPDSVTTEEIEIGNRDWVVKEQQNLKTKVKASKRKVLMEPDTSRAIPGSMLIKRVIATFLLVACVGLSVAIFVTESGSMYRFWIIFFFVLLIFILLDYIAITRGKEVQWIQ